MNTLKRGMWNAVNICMKIKNNENVLILTDSSQRELNDTLLQVLKGKTNNIYFFDLNAWKRPLKDIPSKIRKTLPKCTASFFLAHDVPGEIRMRLNYLHEVTKYARHAHMPSVTRKVVEVGLTADYNKISEISKKVYKKVKKVKRVEIKCEFGTRLLVMISKEYKWGICDGLIRKIGEWSNLPDGEVFTAPYKVDGKLYAILIGDYFAKKYGILSEPILLKIKDSRIKEIEHPNKKLVKELKAYLKTDKNSNRVGEFAFPTNYKLMNQKLLGNLISDEKARVHVAFGDPYSKVTRANWKSSTHVDFLIEKADVWIDEEKVMEKGKYLKSYL